MSYDDDNRPTTRPRRLYAADRRRPAVQPRRLRRRGAAAPAKAPPVTLIVSARRAAGADHRRGAVLSLGPARPRRMRRPPSARRSAQMKVEAPLEAQPVDPEAGVDVYTRQADGRRRPRPTFAPPPEDARRARARAARRSRRAATAPPASRPPRRRPPRRARRRTAPPPTTAPHPAADGAGGSAAVQIGAFSSTRHRRPANTPPSPPASRSSPGRDQAGPGSDRRPTARPSIAPPSPASAASRRPAFCAAIEGGGGDCLVR